MAYILQYSTLVEYVLTLLIFYMTHNKVEKSARQICADQPLGLGTKAWGTSVSKIIVESFDDIKERPKRILYYDIMTINRRDVQTNS